VTDFLGALVDRLADRWMTLLVLPGVLFLAACAVAVRLRHSHWYDVGLLRETIDTIAAGPAAESVGAIAVALVALTAAAALAGLVVQVVASVVDRMWLTEAANPLTRPLIRRRLRRWETAQQRYRTALLAAGRAEIGGSGDPALVREAERRNAERNRIALAAPRRPFWLGDRIGAADRRVLDAYHLDLAAAWPRLWLVLPEGTRTELRTVQSAYSAATRLVVWGGAYLLLGAVWWPAAVIGAGAVLTGRQRGRTAGAILADLLESAVDLHGKDLATALGIECRGRLTPEVGDAVTTALRKQT